MIRPGQSSATWRHVVWYNITRVLKKSYSHDLQGRISCALGIEAIGSSEKNGKFLPDYITSLNSIFIVPAVRIWNIIDTNEQSTSWEVNSSSAIHNISTILCDMKIHHHVRQSSPLVPILNQSFQSMPLSPSYSLNIHFILSWHLCLSPLCSLIPSGFQTKTLYAPLISSIQPTSQISYSHAIELPKTCKIFWVASDYSITYT